VSRANVGSAGFCVSRMSDAEPVVSRTFRIAERGMLSAAPIHQNDTFVTKKGSRLSTCTALLHQDVMFKHMANLGLNKGFTNGVCCWLEICRGRMSVEAVEQDILYYMQHHNIIHHKPVLETNGFVDKSQNRETISSHYIDTLFSTHSRYSPVVT